MGLPSVHELTHSHHGRPEQHSRSEPDQVSRKIGGYLIEELLEATSIIGKVEQVPRIDTERWNLATIDEYGPVKAQMRTHA
jgi:hypothetical protein